MERVFFSSRSVMSNLEVQTRPISRHRKEKSESLARFFDSHITCQFTTQNKQEVRGSKSTPSQKNVSGLQYETWLRREADFPHTQIYISSDPCSTGTSGKRGCSRPHLIRAGKEHGNREMWSTEEQEEEEEGGYRRLQSD